jgi:hypothetical protein
MWNWVHEYLSNTHECLGIRTNIQPFWFFHDILDEYTVCCQSDICTWYHNEFWKIFIFPSVQTLKDKDIEDDFSDVAIHIRRGDLCFHHSFPRRIQCVKYFIETFLPRLEKLSFSENTTVRIFSDCCIIEPSESLRRIRRSLSGIVEDDSNDQSIISDNRSIKKGQKTTHFQYMSNPQQIEHMMDEFHQLIQSSIIYTSGNSGFSFYAALAGSRHYISYFLE